MTHKLTRLTALVLALVMTVSMLLVPVEAASFRDVTDGSWYAAAVEYVNERGWMAGVSETSFAPNANVTRGMMVTVLARLAGAETDNDTSAFADTAAGRWYTGAAAWAAEQGIVAGIGGGRFAPNRAITRQDLCVMLYAYIEAMDIELENTIDRTFSDMGSVADYAREAVIYCAGTGLIAGYTDSTFGPKQTATRAQLAQILMRLDLLIKGEEAPTEPMPAQNFDGEAGEDMSISVNAPEGALPENTSMTVSRITDEDALHSIETKVFGDVVAAADITFTKNGEEIEPETEVEVLLELDGLENVTNPSVVHFKGDYTAEHVEAELVSTTRGGGKALRFLAKDFSVYAVVDDGGSSSNTLTVSFYARENGTSGAWKIVNKQLIRADQLYDTTNGTRMYPIADPGVPNITTSQAFEGWIYGGSAFAANYTYSADSEAQTVAEINDTYNATALTADTEAVYYAAVYDVVYVTYHDQAGAITYAEYKKLVGGSASADITLPYSPFKDNQNFTGWVTSDYVTQIGTIDGTMPTYASGAAEAAWAQGSTQTVTASVDLYPYVEEGFWLIFDNNIEGNNTAFGYDDDIKATYTPSVFVAHGKRVVEPTEPTRPGYDFGGWYTDKAMTTAYNWGSEQNPVYLNEEKTLYAKWDRAATATFTVVVWRQRVSDDKNAADADKTYDYLFSTKLTDTTNSNVLTLSKVTYYQDYHTRSNLTSAKKVLYLNRQPDESDSWYYMEGFHFNRTSANNNNVLRSNGSTVVNVYWDRDLVTYRFYSSSYSEYTSYRATGLYGASFSGWPSDSVTWNLTKNGNAPSSSNTSSTYISISTICQYYDSDEGTPVALRADKTNYFYAHSLSTPYATLSHYCQQLNSSDEPYYPSTAEKTVSQYYMNGHAFREFLGHDNSEYRLKLPSSDTTIYSRQGAASGGSDVSFTAPFKYRLVTAVSGTGTSATVTYSGEWKTTTNNNYWTEWIPYGTGLEIRDYYNEIVFSPTSYGSVNSYQAPGRAIDFRYKLEESTVKYMYGTFVDKDGHAITVSYSGRIRTSDSYYYGQSIASAGEYEPAVPGYVFLGWYSSPECDDPSAYSFTGKTMPQNGVTVYAKFQQMRFRVVCDPTDGNTVTNVTFPSAQATTFRVDYGELVSGTALNAATSPGKILLGWYSDQACTKPFNFSTPITDTIEGMDLTYRTASNKSGSDPWNNNKTYTDDDIVVGKLVIYAKWREDPEGVVGIKVRYLGDHADTDKGYFDTDEKPHEVTMVEVYTDTATASAHSATVPSLTDADTKDDTRRFLYWEILDKNGNPTGEIVYPGAPFEVDIDKAVEVKTLLPDPNCPHTGARTHHDAVNATCETAGNVEYWTCNTCGAALDAASGGNVINPTVAPLGHQWGTVTYTWDPAENLPVDGVVTCTGTVVCIRNSEHTKTATATAQWIVDTDPTTAATGAGHYEATFTDTTAFSKQNSVSVTIPKLDGYIVTFSVPSGVTAPAAQTVTTETPVDLTVAPTGTITGWTFVGWVENTVSQTTTAVTPLQSYTANSDVTLYALYTRDVTTGGTYTRVTSSSNIGAGNYVITYGSTTSTLYAMKGLDNDQWYEGYQYAGATPYAGTGMTLSSSTLSNVSPYYVFTFTKRGTTYTIKNMATGTYLAKYEYPNYGVEPYAVSESFPDYTNYIYWTVAYNSSGYSTLTNNYAPTTVTDYAVLGFDTTRHYFWMGTAGKHGTTGIQLWKQSTAPSTTTYYTTNATALSGYTVTFSTPTGIPAPVSVAVASGNSMVLPKADAPTGYCFVGWATSSVTDTTTAPTCYASGALYKPTANRTLYAVYEYEDTYYKLLSSVPSSVDGYYVISSGTTADCYMMLTRGSTGTMEDTSYKTKISDTTATIGTLNGNTVMRNVPNNNRFYFGTWNSSYSSYYYIQNNSEHYLYDADASSSDAYYLGVCSESEVALSTGGWKITASSGKFKLNPYNYTSHYMSYSATDGTNASGYFGLFNSSSTGVNLWQRTTDYHYLSNPASTSAVPGMVEIENQEGELVERVLPVTDAEQSSVPVETQSVDLETSQQPVEELNSVTVPNPVTATTDKYEIVSSIENDGVYIIAYTNTNTNRITAVSTMEYSSDYGRLLAVQAIRTLGSDNYYTFDTDMSAYQWTAANISGSYYSFYNSNVSKYLGGWVDSNTLYTSLRSSADQWTYNGTYLGLYRSSSNYSSMTGSYYLYWNNSDTFTYNSNQYYSFEFKTSTDSADHITLYKLVEETAPTTYTVTVDSGITNGTVTASPTTAAQGETVTLTVNPASGYEIGAVTYTPAGGSATTITPTNGAYTFTMPAANVTVSAAFNASSAPSTTTMEVWVPTDTITPNEPYLIGFVANGNTYLGLNTGDYYSYKVPYTSGGTLYYSSSNSFIGYTGTPVFRGDMITGVTGNATDLAKATWKFTTVSGGYNIVSGANASYYLHAQASSSNHWWDQYASTSVEVWTWDAANHRLYNSSNGVYAGWYTNDDLSDVYMSCDTSTSSNYIYVQLYKKQTVNLYSVIVESDEHGSVRTDHVTALKDETVELTVTPADGYEIDTVTVTAANGATVTVTHVDGGIYTFTMPASNVTVTATFNEVATANTWKVSFRDEDGKAIPGMNPIYVPKTEPTLNESDLPNSSMEDQYFLGWYQGNTQCTFPMTVTSDITLSPHYSPMYSYDYTLTLRAVYGMYNPDATTHIFWYSNNNTALHNGAGERYTSEYTTIVEGVSTTTTKVPINGRVDIPLPEGPEGQTVYVGDNGGSLTYEDHVFLGWARVENDGSGTEGKEQFLTADDLYIRWINGKYYAKNKYGNLVETTQTYADETQPYHDMYAVWSGYCYIFHSSTGKMEAIEVTGTRGAVDPINIAERVESGKLYGGYYSAYGGVSGITLRPFQNSALSKAADSTQVDKKVEVTGAETYNGSSPKTTGNVRFWTKADAYGQFTVKVNGVNVTHNDDPGTALTPTVGTIYYLKEVPDTYLTTKYLYTYDDAEGSETNGEIQDVIEVTVLDDNLYNDVGFRARDGAETAEQAATGGFTTRDVLAGSFRLVQKNHDPIIVNANSFGLTNGLVAVHNASDEIGWPSSFSLMPVWQTLDNVWTTSHGTLKLTTTGDRKSITFESLGSVPIVYNTLYVNTTNAEWWDSTDAVTRIYFFNDTLHRNTWVLATEIGQGLFRCTIPDGDWEAVVIVRGKKAYTGTDYWSNGRDNNPGFKWNQTQNVTLDRSRNTIIVEAAIDHTDEQGTEFHKAYYTNSIT